jgi:uncharacterized phage infection (PIP) family protein YhgE
MKQTIREAAAETTHTAAERGAAALELAIERLMPLLEQAAERLAPYAEDAKVVAADAKKRTARFAADTVEQFQPQINDALDRVSPAVEKAQRAVQDDLLPKLVDLLHEAADLPVVQNAQDVAGEVQSRGEAAVAALKGELALPKKTSVGKRVAQVAAAGAVLAAVAVAVKTFLGSKDSGWAAHEPSPAYTYAPAATEPETFAEATLVDDGAPVTEATDGPADDAESDAAVADVVENEEASPYGDGSYVGENPPEGYTIKGNNRSMKYHTTESGGYERTIADVWFADEDAAKAAGFVRAQR